MMSFGELIHYLVRHIVIEVVRQNNVSVFVRVILRSFMEK